MPRKPRREKEFLHVGEYYSPNYLHKDIKPLETLRRNSGSLRELSFNAGILKELIRIHFQRKRIPTALTEFPQSLRPRILDLQSKEPEVRISAANAIARSPHPSALPRIEKALETEKHPGAEAALRRAKREAILALFDWAPYRRD